MKKPNKPPQPIKAKSPSSTRAFDANRILKNSPCVSWLVARLYCSAKPPKTQPKRTNKGKNAMKKARKAAKNGKTEELHYLPVWLENNAEPVTPEEAQTLIVALKANWKTPQTQTKTQDIDLGLREVIAQLDFELGVTK